MSIPLEELTERMSEFPPHAEVVAYCRGRYCVLAHEVARLLTEHGFRAARAAEGALEWRVSGRLRHDGAA